jgi:hypothetical protein
MMRSWFEYVFYHGGMAKTAADRGLAARITGTAKRYARGCPLTEDADVPKLPEASLTQEAERTRLGTVVGWSACWRAPVRLFRLCRSVG